MAVKISGADKASPAEQYGLSGGTLLSIDGNEINDMLDYEFYSQGAQLYLAVMQHGKLSYLNVQKEEYQPLGCNFESYLIDKKHSCKNHCMFCFIDQLPPNLRDTLYFKDDDERLSFLFGNYVTLTNLNDREVERIKKMHISPINISVHTVDPALRVRMMANKSAGEVLKYIDEMQNYEVEQVLLPALSKAPAVDNSLALWTLNMIDSLEIPKHTAKAGQEYPIGNGKLTVLSTGIKTKDDYNDISLITKFTADGVSFLSCGDATSAEEKALLESKYDARAQLYKAAHHGSASSNRSTFIEAVSPRMVVVSCGKENDYGHPHKESLKAFAKVGAQVVRTDENGTCIAYVDANGKLQMAVTQEQEQKAA